MLKSKYRWLLLAILLVAHSTTLFSQENKTKTDAAPAISNPLDAASFKFAVIADIHMTPGNTTDLMSITKDIAQQEGIAFVLVMGDVANNGDLQSMKEAKQVLDKMKLPYYAVPGNHDCKLNGVGDAYFKEVFGDTRFRLLCNGNLFLGVNTAELRGGDAHITPEDLEWIKKQLKNSSKKMPLYFIAHHPLQSPDCDNWFLLTEVLRRRNLQAVICGHYHQNLVLENDNIPNIVCGTMQSKNKPLASYTLCAMTNDSLHFFNKRIGETAEQWTAIPKGEMFYSEGNVKLRPNYNINKEYKKVYERWIANVDGALYGPAVSIAPNIYVASHNGLVSCLNNQKGSKVWEYNTFGAMLCSVVANTQYVVAANLNHHLYVLNAQNGSLVWEQTMKQAMGSAPVIYNDMVIVACNDGSVKAFELANGNKKWEIMEIMGNVERLTLSNNKLLFTTWNGDVYCLDAANGAKLWSRQLGVSSRIGSNNIVANADAAFLNCNGKILGLDLKSGKTTMETERLNTVGSLSLSDNMLYALCANDSVVAFEILPTAIQQKWKSQTFLGETKTTQAPIEYNGTLVVANKNGELTALNAADGALIWRHKLGNSLIHIVPAANKTWYLTTSNGEVALLIQE